MNIGKGIPLENKTTFLEAKSMSFMSCSSRSSISKVSNQRRQNCKIKIDSKVGLLVMTTNV